MSTNPPNPARLPILVNLTTNEKHELNSPSITIGRAPENTILVSTDGYASGNHARIYFDQGRWLVEDLNSSNGTTVNDKLITGPWQLNPRDVIKIGRTLFRIE